MRHPLPALCRTRGLNRGGDASDLSMIDGREQALHEAVDGLALDPAHHTTRSCSGST